MPMPDWNHGPSPVRDDAQRRFVRICVAVNDSAAAAGAVTVALALVRGQPGAEVAFCHVLNVAQMVQRAEQSLDDYELALRSARETAHLLLARCRVRARQAGVFARSYIRYGSPADEIRAFADAIGADLVVAGNGSAGIFHRWCNGSVREDLVATCSQPVLIVGATQSRAPEFRPERILVPAADAPDAWPAAFVAADLAGDFAAELVLLHGVERGAEGRKRAIDRAIRAVEPGLIVMAAPPRRRFLELFRASLAERVMRDLAVPVLLVRTAVSTGGRAASR